MRGQEQHKSGRRRLAGAARVQDRVASPVPSPDLCQMGTFSGLKVILSLQGFLLLFLFCCFSAGKSAVTMLLMTSEEPF